jgi:hypothetical protein
MDPLLCERVVAALGPTVGLTLTSVRYWHLHCEADLFLDGEVPPYFGGFVELGFVGAPLIEVDYDENAGWPDHFSLRVRASRPFVGREQHFACFDASGSLLWREHLNAALSRIEVLGWSATPHAVSLGFPAGDVVIGDGYETEFGDGDDLIVCRGQDFRSSMTATDVSTMWRSNYPV